MKATHHISQHIDQRKHSGYYAESQTRDIGQDVLVVRHSRILRHSVQSLLRAAQDPVDDVPEALLEEHREDHAEGYEILQRNDGIPQGRDQ